METEKISFLNKDVHMWVVLAILWVVIMGLAVLGGACLFMVNGFERDKDTVRLTDEEAATLGAQEEA